MLQPEKWIELHTDYLLNYAYYRIHDQALAEDLVQDTFIAALKARDSYNGIASEKTWLTAILKNKIIDYYRSRINKYNKITDSIDHDLNNDYFNADDHFHWMKNKAPLTWNNTEKKIEADEFNKTLIDCMSKLPNKLSAVFSLKYIDEEETDIICKDLGISSSNYWVMMHRAKLQLRECLEKNWFLE